MSFKGRRSLAKWLLEKELAKGQQQLLGTGVGGCSQSCANSSLAFLSGQGEVEKHFFLRKVETAGLDFFLTMPL